jgi:hypothetical protein
MENYTETYEVTLVPRSNHGITRPEVKAVRCTGINSLDSLYYIEDVLRRDNAATDPEFKLGRRIQFYCHNCRSYIGFKTIPLRRLSYTVSSRVITRVNADTEVSIKAEEHRCLACGEFTRYSLQDPILTIY